MHTNTNTNKKHKRTLKTHKPTHKCVNTHTHTHTHTTSFLSGSTLLNSMAYISIARNSTTKPPETIFYTTMTQTGKSLERTLPGISRLCRLHNHCTPAQQNLRSR